MSTSTNVYVSLRNFTYIAIGIDSFVPATLILIYAIAFIVTFPELIEIAKEENQ